MVQFSSRDPLCFATTFVNTRSQRQAPSACPVDQWSPPCCQLKHQKNLETAPLTFTKFFSEKSSFYAPHSRTFASTQGSSSRMLRPMVVPPQKQTETRMNIRELSSEEEFDSLLKSSGDALVLVWITSTTCRPCKLIAPKMAKLCEDLADDNLEVLFLKIVADSNDSLRALCKGMAVRTVPTFQFYRLNEKVHEFSGAKFEDVKASIIRFLPQPDADTAASGSQ